MKDFEAIYASLRPWVITRERLGTSPSAAELLEQADLPQTEENLEKMKSARHRTEAAVSSEEIRFLTELDERYRDQIEQNVRDQLEAGGGVDAGMGKMRELIVAEMAPHTRYHLQMLTLCWTGIHYHNHPWW